MPVSQPEQVARQSSVPSRVDAEPKTELSAGSPAWSIASGLVLLLILLVVPLGRKYELASGLMEITYDTGAKVILQGPVTYEVESNEAGICRSVS